MKKLLDPQKSEIIPVSHTSIERQEPILTVSDMHQYSLEIDVPEIEEPGVLVCPTPEPEDFKKFVADFIQWCTAEGFEKEIAEVDFECIIPTGSPIYDKKIL